MVNSINLILISISAGAFIFMPLIPFITMILKKRTKSMILGMAGFSIYGIILKNLVFLLILLIPFFKSLFSSKPVIYSVFIGIASALIHVFVRYYLLKKTGVEDKWAFTTGESFIHCIYIGIPTVVLNLIYALVINLGGFEYVGITEKLIPVATSLINADYTEFIPYIAYPFWVFALNWLTFTLFIKNKFVSALLEALILAVYSYFMLSRLYILNMIFLLAITISVLFIMIISSMEKRKMKENETKKT